MAIFVHQVGAIEDDISSCGVTLSGCGVGGAVNHTMHRPPLYFDAHERVPVQHAHRTFNIITIAHKYGLATANPLQTGS